MSCLTLVHSYSNHTGVCLSSEVDVDAARADAVVAVNVVAPCASMDAPAWAGAVSTATVLVLHANGTLAAWSVEPVAGDAAKSGFDYGVLQPGQGMRMHLLAVGLPYGTW